MTDRLNTLTLAGKYATVTLGDYDAEDAYIAKYQVTIRADGLTANQVVTDSAGGNTLPRFLEGLAADFRGWDGGRTWRALEDQLVVVAKWQSLGHVELRFELRPNTFAPWSATATVMLEAGEQMRRAAADLATVFAD